MRLNIGCGWRPIEGYLNVDRVRYAEVEGSDFEFMQLDVTSGLPFEDSSVEEIVAYQFVEHLKLAELTEFFDECGRVLADGGEMMLEFPDISYVADEAFRNLEHPVVAGRRISGVPDGLVLLDQVTYGWEHATVLTAALVIRMLEGKGFELLSSERNIVDARIRVRKRV